MLAPLHSATDRWYHEKYFFSIWKYGKISARPQDWLVKVKKRRSDYSSCSVLSNNLQDDLSKRIVFNTSAITAVARSSMEPQSSATTNRHLRGSGERNQEQISFGRTMIRALELQWLAKRHISGRSNVEKFRNQAYIALAVIDRVTLVWRHQSNSQSVSQNKKFLKFHNYLMEGFRIDLKTF